ncbi:hypothetical protein D3C75_571080 [compost metagenome]
MGGHGTANPDQNDAEGRDDNGIGERVYIVHLLKGIAVIGEFKAGRQGQRVRSNHRVFFQGV